jgi:CBS domain-containing protein
MRCQEIMNPKVERIGLEESLQAAATRMRDQDIGFLPVVDKGGLVVGTITDRDIRRARDRRGQGRRARW